MDGALVRPEIVAFNVQADVSGTVDLKTVFRRPVDRFGHFLAVVALFEGALLAALLHGMLRGATFVRYKNFAS